MHLVDFEGCCSAKILTGFGQEETAEWDYRPGREKLGIAAMELELRAKIGQAAYNGNAFVCLTYTQNQTKIASLMGKYGFIRSKAMEKAKHRENVLTLAYLPLFDYEMPPHGDDLVVNARPRDAMGRFVKSNPFKGKK